MEVSPTTRDESQSGTSMRERESGYFNIDDIPDIGTSEVNFTSEQQNQGNQQAQQFTQSSNGQPDNDFSENTLKKQEEDFLSMRKQIEEPDPVNFDDVIFQRLCPEDELKRVQKDGPSQCVCCQKKLNQVISKPHQCKFCGQLVCEQHGRKHREDPERKGQKIFGRICDICEDKYLKRTLNLEFKNKKDKADKQTRQLEEAQKTILEKKKIMQKQIDDTQNKINEENSKFALDENKNTAKINRVQNDIKSLNQEYREAKDKLELVDQQITELFRKIEEKKRQIQWKKDQEKELSNKVVALDQDIKETQYIIDEIEKKITENNLRMEKIKIDRRSNSLIEQSGPGASGTPDNYTADGGNDGYGSRYQQSQPQIRKLSDHVMESMISNTSEENSTRMKSKKKKSRDKRVVGQGNNCGVEQCRVF